MPSFRTAAIDPIITGTPDWGFTGGDIWGQAMLIVASLATFVVLGIVIKFAPRVFSVIWAALFGGNKG